MQKIFLISIIFCLIPLAFALSSNSDNYNTNVATSGGGAEQSSSNYRSVASIGQSAVGLLNSSSYINCVGFHCTLIVSEEVEEVEEGPATGELNAGRAPSVGVKSFSLNSGDFELGLARFSIDLLPDQTKVREFRIKNTGTEVLTSNIENPDLQDLVLLNTNKFILAPKGKKNIKMAFTGSKLGYFKGKLIILADELRKELPITINVSKKPLFDIKVDVLTKDIKPGEDVKANITLLNFGELPVDVYLNYSIKDEKGNILETKLETLAAPLERVIQRELQAPEKEGKYRFHAIITYELEKAESEDSFNVYIEKIVKEEKPKEIIIGLGLVVLVVLALFIIYMKKRGRKEEKVGEELEEKELSKEEAGVKRLIFNRKLVATLAIAVVIALGIYLLKEKVISYLVLLITGIILWIIGIFYIEEHIRPKKKEVKDEEALKRNAEEIKSLEGMFIFDPKGKDYITFNLDGSRGYIEFSEKQDRKRLFEFMGSLGGKKVPQKKAKVKVEKVLKKEKKKRKKIKKEKKRAGKKVPEKRAQLNNPFSHFE